jgi:hypothetical protein
VADQTGKRNGLVHSEQSSRLDTTLVALPSWGGA